MNFNSLSLDAQTNGTVIIYGLHVQLALLPHYRFFLCESSLIHKFSCMKRNNIIRDQNHTVDIIFYIYEGLNVNIIKYLTNH